MRGSQEWISVFSYIFATFQHLLKKTCFEKNKKKKQKTEPSAKLQR